MEEEKVPQETSKEEQESPKEEEKPTVESGSSQAPPLPNINIDNKSVTEKLNEILLEIQLDRADRQAREKELKEKEQEELKKSEELLKEQEELDQEKSEIQEKFLNDFNAIVESSETGTTLEYQEQVQLKLDELIFLKKMDFTSLGVLIALSCVMIFSNQFRK